jgi:glyoxylase-like metal-dependent hydrolase (beta-lactamase superfamily II)
MHRLRLTAAAASGLLVLGVAAPSAGAQSRAATSRLVAQALNGLGGRSAVRGLRTFRLQTTGRTWIFDEGPRPDNAVTPASTFTQTLHYEVRGGAADRLRADSVRTSQGAARRISEVVRGRLGFLAGVDSNGGSRATTAMSSDRWAAVRREQRLLNPQLILRDLIFRPGLASAARAVTLRGRAHRVLVVADDVAPIRLYVDRRTGRIDRLTTVDHQYLRRDVRLIVDYGGWRFVRATTGRDRVRVRFPRTAAITLDGARIHTETRTAIAVNRPSPPSRYAIPGALGARYDAALAARGARTTEWLMSFAQFGFPKDGPATRIVPRPIAPGSTLIQGIPNNSMIVEQAGGIVVVEAALSDARAEALLRYIGTTYPGKPVRYVTASHHHADHSGGVRPFAALGATVVIGADAVPLFTRTLSDRSSRLLPDRLDRTNRPATIRTVPASGRITLTDAVRPVIVLPERTAHATTTILVYVPDEGVLFVNGDTYTPGGPAGPGAISLEQTIEADGLLVKWIVGGHGTIVPYAEFRAAIGRPLP